ncbi:MAG: hypothetical protein KDC53_21470 [Saprospiraceae bacterium]|nr:hypothetical protein [Saprospiraceae bacterium]
MTTLTTFFAPQLYIPSGINDLTFYLKAFEAEQIRSWLNVDGSIHVAELSINGAIFQVHEEGSKKGQFEPNRIGGITTLIGLFVPDVDVVIERSLKVGATLLDPVQDYDYGYRQGKIKDPFGHHWMIQTEI